MKIELEQTKDKPTEFVVGECYAIKDCKSEPFLLVHLLDPDFGAFEFYGFIELSNGKLLCKTPSLEALAQANRGLIRLDTRIVVK